MSRIYAYLRASTKEQDATRAQKQLNDFAESFDRKISFSFIENESGAKLERPELFRLLNTAERGDILLVEQVDRISRLNSEDWDNLKSLITNKGILIVSLDLSTSHQLMKANENVDDFTVRISLALNGMLLDMLAAVARKDYEDRRRRQMQGIEKAKELGKFKGRKRNVILHSRIQSMLAEGATPLSLSRTLKISPNTVYQSMKYIAEEGAQS